MAKYKNQPAKASQPTTNPSTPPPTPPSYERRLIPLDIVPPRGFGSRPAAPVGSGAFPLGSGAFPLGGGAFPLGGGAFPLGGGAFPLGGGAFPLGSGITSGNRAALTVGIGWHPDMPDGRDRMITHEKIQAVLKDSAIADTSYLLSGQDVPEDEPWDLRSTFKKGRWPVEDQGTLGSCTAHAAIGLVEYLVYQQCHERMDLSRLFLYKAARRLLGWYGDTGCYIRTTIRALARFGVPPEEQWPYDITRFDEDPDAFLYAYAKEFQAIQYARFDAYGASAGQDTLRGVKRAIRDGFPVAFGFPVYSSFNSSAPDIPYPDLSDDGDSIVGGHAVLAIGYDDSRPVVYDGDGPPPAPGALLIRNSWGPNWGDDGYGYIPYEFVRQQLALDFWTIIKQNWVSDRQFRE